MPAYRFLAYDLMTMQRMAELPLTGVQYGELLNRAGSFRATMPIGDVSGSDAAADRRRLRASELEAASKPRKTAVFVERNRQVVWGGIVWRRGYAAERREYLIEGAQFWSIFHRRLITDTLSWVQQDQTSAMVAQMVAYAQSKPGADHGVTLNTPASGVLRDDTHWFYENKYVGPVIEGMTDNLNGFDFALLCQYDNVGDIALAFETYYPQRGRRLSATSHVFEYDKNVFDFAWPEDGWTSANSLHLVGAGEAVSMLRASQTDSAQIGTYPLLETGLMYKDITVQQTLNDRAGSQLEIRKDNVTVPTLYVLGGSDPSLGGYICGDEIRFRVPPARDPRFPNGFEDVRRIAGITVNVPDDHSDEVVAISTMEAQAA